MADLRKSSYAFIVYEESTDIKRMLAYLELSRLACAVSPLHDRDTYDYADIVSYEDRKSKKAGHDFGVDPWEVKPIEGALKKPHYHVIVSYGKVKKSRQQVLDFVHSFAPDLNFVMPIDNLSAYTKYLIHKCDQDKAQYSADDVRAFGGFDLAPLWASTRDQKCSDLQRVFGWCRKYQIYNYCDLVDVCIGLDDKAIFELVVERSFPIRSYLEGIYAEVTGAITSNVDIELVTKSINDGIDYKADVTGFVEVA